MTFEEIMLIIADKTKTDRQKGADLEAAFIRASKPSAMTIQPQKTRKASRVKVRQEKPVLDGLGGFKMVSDDTPMTNGADHAG